MSKDDKPSQTQEGEEEGFRSRLLSTLRRRSFFLAIGLMFILDGIVFAVVNITGKAGFKESWPLLMMSAGVAFFAADYLVYKRIRASFLFPSVMMFALGVIFLLFSTNVFHVQFRKFISVFWPIVLFVFGVILVSIYGMQKVNKSDFPYIQDDYSDDSY